MPGEEFIVTALLVKKRGKHHLYGEKLDRYLQETIVAMRNSGSAIGTDIVKAIGRGTTNRAEKRRGHGICRQFRGPASSQLYISGGVYRKIFFFRSDYS